MRQVLLNWPPNFCSFLSPTSCWLLLKALLLKEGVNYVTPSHRPSRATQGPLHVSWHTCAEFQKIKMLSHLLSQCQLPCNPLMESNSHGHSTHRNMLIFLPPYLLIGSCYVAQAGLEITIECWDHRYAPSCPAISSFFRLFVMSLIKTSLILMV
jgi:hypothetical protein